MTKYIFEPDKEDDGLEVPETYVRHLQVTHEKADFRDDFLTPAGELKSMDGQSPVFKRKVTRELNKVRRGADGAESKQIEEEAEYTGYQMFDVILPPYNMDYLAKLYQDKSSPHYAAVNAKVANIVGLGFKFVETAKTKRGFEQNSKNKDKTEKARRKLEQHRDELTELIDTFNQEDEFIETLMKVWTDFETMGNAYIEIGRKKNGQIGYIGHIPAQTMRIRKHRDGFVQISGYRVQFFANFGDVDDVRNPIGGGTPNEVIHLKKYSPTNGFYGVPDIVAALHAIAGNEFATRFNLDYFENKAVPRHLITLKGAKLGRNAEEALLAFFETGLKGQNHRSLFIPLPGDSEDSKVEFKIDAVEAGVQDSSFEKYRKANMNDILMVHRVPISKISVGEGMSLAIAKDADKTFKEQVCAPWQRILEKKLNRIFREMTDALEIRLNEMTLTDEDTQSKIDERRIKTGQRTSNELRARDGLPAHEQGDELVDLNAKDKIAQQTAELTATRERDAARSAGATDSAGAARNPKGEGRSTP